MALTYDPSSIEVDNNGYIAGSLVVGTTPIEAKVGGSRLSQRQKIIVYNPSSLIIFFGPLNVSPDTGIPIFAKQVQELNFGDYVPVYLVSPGGPATIIVHEVA